MAAAIGFFVFLLGTQERVRNSRGKRAIRVRAIEVLLYVLGNVFTKRYTVDHYTVIYSKIH